MSKCQANEEEVEVRVKKEKPIFGHIRSNQRNTNNNNNCIA